MMKGKTVKHANVACLGDFAGISRSNLEFLNYWIIDSGASAHMWSNKSLMHDLVHLSSPRGTVEGNLYVFNKSDA